MHSFKSNCTDENVISAPLRTVRVVPGVYGLNGTIKIGQPINKDYKVSHIFNLYFSMRKLYSSCQYKSCAVLPELANSKRHHSESQRPLFLYL